MMTATQLPLDGLAEARPNRYPGTCVLCGQKVPAQKGLLGKDHKGRWQVTHKVCPKTSALPKNSEGKVTSPPSFNVPDGYFTVVFENNGEHRTIRVRTQDERANFKPGLKVLSYLSGPDNTSNYTQFAHVDEKGIVRYWQRFKDAESLHLAVRVLSGDPEACAKAFGLRSGKCGLCGRHLTDPESIKAGIGPVCRNKAGW